MSNHPKGYLALVLHAHLPFVRHPEHEEFLEEVWLYEAITETYLPLLAVMEGWQCDGVEWRLTMSLTPTLCSMLGDELLQTRYVRHLERLLELAEREVERTATAPEFYRTAVMYRDTFRQRLHEYEEVYGRDLLGGFRRMAEAGRLEIITCAATHGYLPLLQQQPDAVRAQVAIAVDHHRSVFGEQPRGIWNPECGYYPGLEEVLAENGIEYFFTDSHAILFASQRPKYGVFAPLKTPAGPYAFGRDQESSKSVWSTQLGYPGDPRYREFYRDIGFDLDMDYLGPYVNTAGGRVATGIKYYRITGKTTLQEKGPYDEVQARDAAGNHSGHFLFSRQQQVLHLSSLIDRPPLVVSPYDAELFGHWWYEGPLFLDYLVRKIHYDQDDIGLTTPRHYLEMFPENQEATPSLSSWGHGGFSEVWLEGSNDWIYRHLDHAAERMTRMAAAHPDADEMTARALDQCARELLLAQGSDWAFIMKTGTTVDYAVKRTKEHLNHFLALSDMVERGEVEGDYLAALEWRNNIFPDVDYRVYAPR